MTQTTYLCPKGIVCCLGSEESHARGECDFAWPGPEEGGAAMIVPSEIAELRERWRGCWEQFKAAEARAAQAEKERDEAVGKLRQHERDTYHRRLEVAEAAAEKAELSRDALRARCEALEAALRHIRDTSSEPHEPQEAPCQPGFECSHCMATKALLAAPAPEPQTEIERLLEGGDDPPIKPVAGRPLKPIRAPEKP